MTEFLNNVFIFLLHILVIMLLVTVCVAVGQILLNTLMGA